MSRQIARKPERPTERVETTALLGFVFTLAGTFLFPPLLIVGLTLSVLGLRAKDRLVFSILGLIVSIIMLILWTIIVIDILVAARVK